MLRCLAKLSCPVREQQLLRYGIFCSCIGLFFESLQSLLQGLAEWFVCKADVRLMDIDEPEKARKLGKMLGAFLHLDNGGTMDSLDA